jgi:hypothetical protein
MMEITEKNTHKAVSKRKRANQGKVQPSVTIGMHTPGPSADDVNFLTPL